MKRILVLAAHPDDEIIGCFGVIKKAIDAKDDIRVVYVTDGASRVEPRKKAKLRIKAVKECWNDLGLKNLTFMNFAVDSTTDVKIVKKIYAKLKAIYKKYKPTEVYVPAFEGGHFDHDVLNFLASKFKVKTREFQLYNNHLDPLKFIQMAFREAVKKLPLPFYYWNTEHFIPVRTVKPFYLKMSSEEIDMKNAVYTQYQKIAEAPFIGKRSLKRIPRLGPDLLREIPKQDYSKRPHRGLLPLGYELAFGIPFSKYKYVVNHF